MQRRLLKALLVVVLSVSAVLPAGCTGGGPANPGPVQQDMTVAVYYPKATRAEIYLVREAHTVPQTQDLKQAAVEELIKGQPQTSEAYRVLPENTRVLSVKTANSLATVDFSREVLQANVGSGGELEGIQSIVNTLTEFPDVEQVSFTVEGGLDERARDWWGHVGLYEQPFKRDLSSVREPAIWVTSPQPGAEVGSPLGVTGSAMVWEATVSLRLVTGDGRKLAEDFTTASIGAPERGDFSASLTFESPGSGDGFLEVYWSSPKDGSELEMARVPVKF